MTSLLSQLGNKFNENFWSSHFNSQSKCVINDRENLIPINQKGGGDFIKVVSPLTNSGLTKSDSIGRKRKKRTSKKQPAAKKRKVTKKRKSKSKSAQTKRKPKGSKKTKGKKKSTTAKNKKKKTNKNRRSGTTKRR